MSKKQAFRAEKLFTGNNWLYDHIAVVENGRVTEIRKADMRDNDAVRCHLLAPAFFDLQIYGAHGKLLAVYPQEESLYLLHDYCAKGGAPFFQPTVATNDTEVFHRCIDAVRAYWKSGGKGCVGLHIEGPWISQAKRGAHLPAFIHAPSLDEAKALLEYGRGVITMITLAPEVCSSEIIELIRSYGVVVSAGHSDATYQQATAAFDLGITAATHLYNAMSPLQHRAPGMVGAILSHHKVRSSIVPDGFHVDFTVIRLAKCLMKERLFAITDAVTETGEGPYPHHLNGNKYESNGILSGSALTMVKCVHNLVNEAGIALDEALRMVSLYPAQVLNLSHIGRIETGGAANLVLINEALEVMDVVMA